MLAARINGEDCAAGHSISVDDRGLNYGDGLFETMLLQQGSIRFFHAHLGRLRQSCERLAMRYPGDEVLDKDVSALTKDVRDGVVKILLTRGSGGRGYRPAKDSAPTRIVTLHARPDPKTEIKAQWCSTRLSRNPALAGMKHTNRLEQVLAAAELIDSWIDEGLMLDLEGEVVCGTSSNVFIVRHGELMTPDLRYCGVRGIMRAQVLRTAHSLGIAFHEEPLYPHDIEAASELFVTNAVRGIRAVIQLAEHEWPRGSITEALSQALDAHA